MPRTTYYEENTRMLDAVLHQKIKNGIEQFLLLKNPEKKHLKFSKAETFWPLIDEIENKLKAVQINPKWLIDLYAGRKTGHKQGRRIKI